MKRDQSAINEFLYSRTSWFDRDYARLDSRFASMKLALSLWLQRGGGTIVETGCARQRDDWGGGMSTVLFAEAACRLGGTVHTIDISRTNMQTCLAMVLDKMSGLGRKGKLHTRTVDGVDEFAVAAGGGHVHGMTTDSVLGLAKLSSVDLLYLDSFDYPFGEILNHFGGQHDIDAAVSAVYQLSDEEVVERFGGLIAPCQQHTVKEWEAARGLVHNKTVVMIDDNALPGGGKPRLLKPILAQEGWTCLWDAQQTLWVKGGTL